jgi:ATP-dependent DNA ligase
MAKSKNSKKVTHPTLYHEGRTGKLYQWKVWTEGADIVTEYGTVDGEKSLARKTVKGKNIGKKNQTDPEEQAGREAKAMWTKKLEGKYSKSKTKALDTVFLPMLAHDWNKQKKKPEFPLDVQPKLDGVRCMAWREGDEIILMSRGGKQYDVAHIKKDLEDLKLQEGYVLDGELYVHGQKLQDTVRLVKKHRDGPEGSALLKFICYDYFDKANPETPWSVRRALLEEILMETAENARKIKEKTKEKTSIDIISTKTIRGEGELVAMLSEYEKRGYEGLIARTHDATYNLGHRSRGLLKLKNFQDAEFKVIGFTESSGNDKGCVVWECETDVGKTFTVRPVGTREQRKEWFQSGDEYIGKMLTVKFQAWTKDRLPQFPVGVAFRNYE